ncbi:MAG TPA: hypothetical protein VF304_05980 [Casimicrobiaceae bacterium]
MKSLVRSALAAVAAGVTLAGCATYDYGLGYAYPQPYDGYNYDYSYGYDNGPYSYDGSPYYYGPSVGLGFTYRDRDRRYDDRNYDRDYNWRRDSNTGRDNDYRRGDNDQWRGDERRSRSAAPWPSGRDDPWGGTNKPNDRTSQQ